MSRRTGALAVVLLAMCGLVVAQSTQAPATLDDLLSEIRGLRGDIARSSNATVRTQMLVARMQIQEQRINTIVRQITEAQNEMAGAKQMVAVNEGQLKRAEAEIASATGDDRLAAQLALADLKERIGPVLAQFQQRVQELTLRESELMNQFSIEQVHWNDFHDRLDALERSLQTQ